MSVRDDDDDDDDDVAVLRDENERMRQYMECLVSKAMSTCPSILCVDTSKFF